jgi:Erythromycin biosynthesis protein CIII-like, N-terminal domain
MRVLFTACPMFGHVNTLLPLALAARRAGHEVVPATGADHAGRVERAGVAAWAVGPTFAEAGWPPRSPLDFVAAADKRCVDLLPQAQRWRPDLVVHEETEPAGAIVAARTGARHVTHGLGIAVGGGDAFAPILDDLGARWRVADIAATVTAAPYSSICPQALGAPTWPDTRFLRPSAARPAPGEQLPASVTALPFERTVHLTLGTVFAASGPLAAALCGLRELPVNVV